MSDKMKNFLVRTASGIVLLAVVLGAILWSKWSFGVLLLAIIIGGEREFYRLATKAGYQPQKYLGYIAGGSIFIIAFACMLFLISDSTVSDTLLILAVILLLYIMLLLPMMFVCELYRKSPTPIANIGTTLMGIVYVAMPMSLLLFIPVLLGQGEWSPLAVLFYIFIIWANDVFAYMFGITLGKHRLFERISPKKSWEGFVGGLLGAMAMGYLASVVMDGNPIEWIGLALIAAISGVFGDLVESLFKRSVDVKDSGHILPGHGGWLDRFDALILSVPFVFLYLIFFAIA
ncbi:MAG: phosphatidate cytidylyltransferase [Alistipes sp.]|nr:phosphatidate cytidylyltransferase [Alistipes sp.]